MARDYPPIAVLDSGLGGLTVARAIRKLAPAENILYFGDTARLPYGSKSPQTVTAFVQQIVTYLQQYDPKHIVIACNTATAVALPTIKLKFPHLTITGVIDPGARAAAKAAGNQLSPRIAVIATQATVESKAYEKALIRRRHLAHLDIRATPLLASIIEDGRDENDLLTRVALNQYLKPIHRRKPDVLVLGCTHYPVLKRIISRMMGPTCRIIDSAHQCAADVTQSLAVNQLSTPALSPGWLKCFVTDDPKKFQSLAPRFLGSHIDQPTLVRPEQLTASAPPQPTIPLRLSA